MNRVLIFLNPSNRFEKAHSIIESLHKQFTVHGAYYHEWQCLVCEDLPLHIQDQLNKDSRVRSIKPISSTHTVDAHSTDYVYLSCAENRRTTLIEFKKDKNSINNLSNMREIIAICRIDSVKHPTPMKIEDTLYNVATISKDCADYISTLTFIQFDFYSICYF